MFFLDFLLFFVGVLSFWSPLLCSFRPCVCFFVWCYCSGFAGAGHFYILKPCCYLLSQSSFSVFGCLQDHVSCSREGEFLCLIFKIGFYGR